MTAFDIDAALRWFRFDPQRRLARRPDAELPFLGRAKESGAGLLLDTCVYIDQMRGRLPEAAAHLLETRHLHHSTVGIQELMFGLGLLDPKDRRTVHAVATIHDVVQAMQPHRTFAPDADLLGRAAMIAGLLSRSQGYTGDNRRRAMMDATLFLQGHKLGLVMLTRNIGDFDLMLQMMPSARSLFYRIPDAVP